MPQNLHTGQARKTIPEMAIFWGWAGVVPFALLTGTAISLPADVVGKALQMLVAYGAIILTFMGGVHWGIAMKDGEGRAWLYTTGILPSLVAVLAIALPSKPAIVTLAIGFAGLLVYDIQLVRHGHAPKWYARLRLQLTLAVIACLTVAGLTA